VRLRDRRVSEIMQTEVATLARGDRVDLADDIMRLGRVRHMPVVERGRLVGVVTARDVLAASLTRALEFEPAHRRAFLKSVEVREVMSTEVVSLGPEATLGEAAELMLTRKIGCLPVTGSDGRLLGLVTETDLLRAAFGEPAAAGLRPEPPG
jgi:CBS domain-containing protein